MNVHQKARRILILKVCLVLLALGLAPEVSRADTCFVASGFSTDVFANNTSNCGVGVDLNPGANADQQELQQVTGLNLAFVEIDEDATANLIDNGFFFTATTANTEGQALTGTWQISSTVVNDFDNLILVLKDGNVEGTTVQWVWFKLVDVLDCLAGTAFCGDWGMFNNTSGNTAGLSHMELWGVPSTGPGPGPGPGPGNEVPEPSAIILFGSGLLASIVAKRRLNRTLK